MEYHSHHSPDRTSFFFFNDTSTTEIYTLSLHDALPICVIDTLYGGTGRLQTRIEGRDFSHTEQRVINRLVNVICEEYKKAWHGIYPLELGYQRSEMQPQFANIATPSEKIGRAHV